MYEALSVLRREGVVLLRSANRAQVALLLQREQQLQQERLWQDLFSNPSEWWDNRCNKRKPGYPDFRHRTSREPLWLNSPYKPLWVDSQLCTLRDDDDHHNLHDQQDHHLLQALCDQGHLDAALTALSCMDTSPPTHAYLSLLKACSKRKALSQAKQVQAHLAQHRPKLTGLLGDYLVVTLAKCGAVDDACHVSDALPHRTVFSWTAIISGCVECGQGAEALQMYQYMQEDGVEPDHYTFASLFKACGSIPDLEEGKKLHTDARQKGFTSDAFVGNTLVSMYGKCGATVEAGNVFCVLSHRDVVSWNAMLSAFVDQGQGEKALRLYRQMQEEGESPSNLTFVTALQACGTWAESKKVTFPEAKMISLDIGKALHADVQKKGFASDVFVGNTLVSMYGKCGALVEAENVFSALSQRTCVSWNAMLSAYVEHGRGQEALQLYKDMQEKHEAPNQLTLVIALQACGTLAEKEEPTIVEGLFLKVMSLEIGQGLHADARNKGFASDIHISNTLVSMYGKCGSIAEAEDVFTALFHRNNVSWSTMLSAYVEQGLGEKALQLYRHIYEEGASPDWHTLAIALQACGIVAEKEEATVVEGQPTKIACLEIVRALHADARAFPSEAFLDTTLLSLYGKCGTIVEAENVFGALLCRDVVSWTAMLSAYVDQDQGEKALQLYRQMQEEGMSPNHLTYVMALKACSVLTEEEGVYVEGESTKSKSLEIVHALHADAWRAGFTSHAFVANTLVSMYGKCGTIEEAEHVFSMSSHRDVVSWTGMLSAYVEQSQGEKALQLYACMQEEGLSPNQLTLVIALQACSALAEKEEAGGRSTKLMALELGQALHADAFRKNFVSDSFIGNTLLTMYGKCGSIVEVEEVFNSLSCHDSVSWTVMLSAYVEHDQGEKALHLYTQIQKMGVTLDDVTLTCILQACGETGSLATCKRLHFTATCAGHDLKPFLAATLIHAYGSCASTIDGQAVFDGLPCPHLSSWNACIAGYAGEGSCVASLHMFQKLLLGHVMPDGITFTSVFSTCSHAGLVGKGLDYFESMRRYYSIIPGLKHFVSLIDLLGRAGDFKRVENMLERIPVQADLTIWLCLLGACRIHANMELAKQAFDNAVSLQPREAAVYVLMSSM